MTTMDGVETGASAMPSWLTMVFAGPVVVATLPPMAWPTNSLWLGSIPNLIFEPSIECGLIIGQHVDGERVRNETLKRRVGEDPGELQLPVGNAQRPRNRTSGTGRRCG